jgi:hypothetical protein
MEQNGVAMNSRALYTTISAVPQFAPDYSQAALSMARQCTVDHFQEYPQLATAVVHIFFLTKHHVEMVHTFNRMQRMGIPSLPACNQILKVLGGSGDIAGMMRLFWNMGVPRLEMFDELDVADDCDSDSSDSPDFVDSKSFSGSGKSVIDSVKYSGVSPSGYKRSYTSYVTVLVQLQAAFRENPRGGTEVPLWRQACKVLDELLIRDSQPHQRQKDNFAVLMATAAASDKAIASVPFLAALENGKEEPKATRCVVEPSAHLFNIVIEMCVAADQNWWVTELQRLKDARTVKRLTKAKLKSIKERTKIDR